MARVRAIRLCFVDNGLRKEGDVFEYNGRRNANLEYLDGEQPEEMAAEVAAEPEAERPARKWTPKAKRAATADEGVV